MALFVHTCESTELVGLTTSGYDAFSSDERCAASSPPFRARAANTRADPGTSGGLTDRAMAVAASAAPTRGSVRLTSPLCGFHQ